MSNQEPLCTSGRHEPFPLTDLQQAYWLGRSASFELGNVATHFYFEVEGQSIDLQQVTRAWRRLVDRHDALRLVVLPNGSQRALEQVPAYEIKRLDLRGFGCADAEAHLAKLRHEMSHQVLDPLCWPLFDLRAAILPDRVRLLFSIDGLLVDGWSLRILLAELARLYDDLSADLPDLAITFRDYVIAEQNARETPAWQESLSYWQKRLVTLPPRPDLTLARGQRTSAAPKFVRQSDVLEPEAWRSLQSRAAQAGLTPSAVLLAVYAEAIAYFSASPRFTINVALMNRTPIHPHVDDIIGEFASFMLLEVDAERRDSFGSRIKRLQRQMWQDLQHTQVSGLEVLRGLGRVAGQPVSMPVAFTSVLNQKSRGAEPSIGDLLTRVGDLGTVVYKISQTSQVWLDFHVYELGGGLGYNLDALDGHFPPGMLEDMFGALRGLVVRLATEDAIWSERSPRMLSAATVQLQADINRTAAPVPKGNLTTRILAQASEHPDRLAVVSDQQRLTYADLVDRARRLARAVSETGVGQSGLVGIVMEKGWQQVVAAIGVLEAGLAYLPLDVATPPERLASVLEMAGVDLVLTEARLSGSIAWPAAVRILHAETACASKPLAATSPADPASLAMVLLTSGSTGRPRGVMLTHQGPLNAVIDLNRRFEIGNGDRLLSLTPMQHDMAAYDLFGILAAGGLVVMPHGDLVRDPAHWLELMHAEGVTVWNTVPAMLQMLLDYVEQKGARLPATLRLVFLGGDFIPLDFQPRLLAQVPGIRLVSLGGPTETSICSLFYAVDQLDPSWLSIPYGRPLSNQRVYVLDDNLEARPIGVPGQIFNAGLGLARGYLGDAESTQLSFIEHPRTGERLYRTGDLGAYRSDGTLEILGRVDFQIKIRGHRIEPAEIEHRLCEHADVRSAVVIGTGKPGARRELVAYVVLNEPAPSAAILRDFVAARLPCVMVPLHYVHVERFPLSTNGKVDRRALQALRPNEPARPVPNQQLSERQQIVQAAIASVLNLSQSDVRSHDTFLELGGDSLRAVLLQSKLRDALNVEVPLGHFFAAASIETIDNYVAAAGSEKSVALRKLTPRADRQRWPLSSAQSRLFLLSQMTPEAPLFNLSIAIRLRGALEVRALEAALREIKRRHEVLRATFSLGAEREPIQSITADVPVQLPVQDLFALAPSARWAEFERVAGEDARRPFDLERGPLLSELLIRFEPEDHALVISVHHLVADGWSFGVLLQELRDLYAPFAPEGPSPLDEPLIQYADYAAWERHAQLDPSEALERAGHWRNRLQGASGFLPMPTDRERPDKPCSRGALHPIAIVEDGLKSQLARLCAAERVTPYMALLGAYAITLGAWTGESDMVVGAPLANRKDVQTERLIGCFVNMIPLRVRLSEGQNFRDFLAQLRGEFVGDVMRELPFDQLVRAVNPARKFGRTPVFQAVLQLDAMSVPVLAWPGLTGELVPLDAGTARYELAVRLVESPDGFAGQINYRRDLWEPESMQTFARTFAATLAHAVANTDASIHTLVTQSRAFFKSFSV